MAAPKALANSSTIPQLPGSFKPLPAPTTMAASGNGIEPVMGFKDKIEALELAELLIALVFAKARSAYSPSPLKSKFRLKLK